MGFELNISWPFEVHVIFSSIVYIKQTCKVESNRIIICAIFTDKYVLNG